MTIPLAAGCSASGPNQTTQQAPVPTIGRIVLYTLPNWQAEEINRRRKDASDKMDWHRALKSGAQVHVGNSVKDGQVVPAIIVAVWGNTPECAVNLKCLLDGTDDFWATSVSVGDKPGSFAWPVRA